MSRADMIPDKVWRKAMYEYHKIIRIRPASAWKEAVAAAINAWPGSYSLAEHDSAEIRGVAAIILPLPQEVSDE